MIPLVNLFDITKKERLDESIQHQYSRSVNNFKNLTNISNINCPNENDIVHKEDMSEVIRCYQNPILPQGFLKTSDDSVKKIFKNFLKNNDLDYSLAGIKDVLKDVGTIIHKEKQKHKRQRPKHFLKKINKKFKKIKDMKSFSFPSGHTAEAYFVANVLKKEFPKFKNDFEEIARLIGQSRIENAVHFPSDVLAGRFLGELLYNTYNESNNKDNLPEITKKDQKDLVKKLRKKAKKYYPKLTETQQLAQYCEDITQFIELSNKIENLDTNYTFDAVKKFMTGYPVKYCSDDPAILSHLNALVAINKINQIGNINNLLFLHNQLNNQVIDKGDVGMLRLHHDDKYSKPNMILNYIKRIDEINNPFVKHMIFEWIHPYPDGNGRIGRVILSKDLDYNFQKVCDFCDNDYFKKIKNFKSHHGTLENLFN